MHKQMYTDMVVLLMINFV